jgi:hypothetical protein
MTTHRLTRARALTALVALIAALAAFAQPASADSSDLKINEVESNGGTPGDWVEVINNGTTSVDLGGFKFRDNDPTHAQYAIPAGTTLAPGGYYLLEEAASTRGSRSRHRTSASTARSRSSGPTTPTLTKGFGRAAPRRLTRSSSIWSAVQLWLPDTPTVLEVSVSGQIPPRV